jgi:CubicO group peptidase (beta-lactamase class C family)
MTAAAILLLAEERKLSLEDKLSKFVPDFPNGDKITVEELLTHYSGLGDASAQPDYNEWSRFPQTTAALVERAKKFPGKVSRAQPTSIVTRTITFWLS